MMFVAVVILFASVLYLLRGVNQCQRSCPAVIGTTSNSSVSAVLQNNDEIKSTSKIHEKISTVFKKSKTTKPKNKPSFTVQHLEEGQKTSTHNISTTLSVPSCDEQVLREIGLSSCSKENVIRTASKNIIVGRFK
ncbi:unnamed protein product [Parnassius apollo]|uniref:(apollo) hypothetical protein n=1 Tax=Parnassius apollo TaxID=110799 RepID=A0A8S3Y084_PARAO|nr:unnamed protein product [Parnassius apollo]